MVEVIGVVKTGSFNLFLKVGMTGRQQLYYSRVFRVCIKIGLFGLVNLNFAFYDVIFPTKPVL